MVHQQLQKFLARQDFSIRENDKRFNKNIFSTRTKPKHTNSLRPPQTLLFFSVKSWYVWSTFSGLLNSMAACLYISKNIQCAKTFRFFCICLFWHMYCVRKPKGSAKGRSSSSGLTKENQVPLEWKNYEISKRARFPLPAARRFRQINWSWSVRLKRWESGLWLTDSKVMKCGEAVALKRDSWDTYSWAVWCTGKASH